MFGVDQACLGGLLWFYGSRIRFSVLFARGLCFAPYQLPPLPPRSPLPTGFLYLVRWPVLLLLLLLLPWLLVDPLAHVAIWRGLLLGPADVRRVGGVRLQVS